MCLDVRRRWFKSFIYRTGFVGGGPVSKSRRVSTEEFFKGKTFVSSVYRKLEPQFGTLGFPMGLGDQVGFRQRLEVGVPLGRSGSTEDR